MDKTQVLLRLQSVLTPAARPAAAGVIYMGEGALYQVLFIDHHKSQQKLFEIHIIHLTEQKKVGGRGGFRSGHLLELQSLRASTLGVGPGPRGY